MTNIVMLVKDRLRLTKQSIESLYQNTPVKDFTITILDDDSQDFRVKKYLRGLSYRNLSLLEVQNSSHVLAQLKNVGAYYSEQRFGRGDFLYLSDSDVYFLPGWLNALTDMANRSYDAGYRLWGGQIHPFHQPINTERLDTSFTEHSILDGPSWLMRWKTWDGYGPLDRKCAPGVCMSEEYPFCQRLTAPVNPIDRKAVEWAGGMVWGGHRIGVIQPHVVIHTGLTNSEGKDAPGRKEREAMIPAGVLAE